MGPVADPPASIIYLGPSSLAASNDLPPGHRASNPYSNRLHGTTPGIFGLSTHKVYPYAASLQHSVGSYPAFSPLPHLAMRRYIFCGTGCFHGVQPQNLPVRKYGALCCPDFPYPRTSRDTIEQIVTTAKLQIIHYMCRFSFLVFE